jgi:hypothetical protein
MNKFTFNQSVSQPLDEISQKMLMTISTFGDMTSCKQMDVNQASGEMSHVILARLTHKS